MNDFEIRASVSEVERCTTVDGPGIRTIVFLKGCPLHCLWCHNPENISPQFQMGWEKGRCIGCLKCVSVCEHNAISAGEEGLVTDTLLCTVCGKCEEVCPSKARKQFGSRKGVGEIFEEVTKDKAFYDKTGGGVTVSGGEPLSQPVFTKELFKRCREAGINTALDTSGYAARSVLESVLSETDMVLLDLKQADPLLHKKYTGVDPDIIFSNFERICEMGVPTWIRTPVVPGYTDQESNIIKLARMISGKSCVKKWELLPYHSFGEKKYNELQIKYPLHSIPPPVKERMERLRDIALNICGAEISVQ